ncbi:hypothetical protein L7F22_002359 [Adiantum nelumboides]|nr:hypothetical protein [Adiantum nelumboides]
MAGACTALRSPAIQSPSSYQQAADCQSRASSISRLYLSNYQRPSLLRIRTRAPSSSACFNSAPNSTRGLQCNSFYLTRRREFSLAASSEDLASFGTKGTETDSVDEASSKAVNDLSNYADQAQVALNADASTATGKGAKSGQDAVADKGEVLKAETAKKDDSSEPPNKFMGVLRDTTEELKEHAEKARAAFAVTAQETAAVLAATAQETAKKTDTPKKFAKIHDFCLGIPYGGILVIGGFLWFIVSGSTAPIRFGVLLGGILLGLSVTSLSAWKEGKPTTTYIIGQAVISSILALRQIRRFFEAKAFFPSVIFTLISVGMLGFFCYVFLAGGSPPPKQTKHAPAV